METGSRRKITVHSTETDLDRALRKIYESYGPNLLSFFRDVQQQLKREAAEEEERRLVNR